MADDDLDPQPTAPLGDPAPTATAGETAELFFEALRDRRRATKGGAGRGVTAAAGPAPRREAVNTPMRTVCDGPTQEQQDAVFGAAGK
eukprot:gene4659-41078_t